MGQVCVEYTDPEILVCIGDSCVARWIPVSILDPLRIVGFFEILEFWSRSWDSSVRPGIPVRIFWLQCESFDSSEDPADPGIPVCIVEFQCGALRFKRELGFQCVFWESSMVPGSSLWVLWFALIHKCSKFGLWPTFQKSEPLCRMDLTWFLIQTTRASV